MLRIGRYVHRNEDCRLHDASAESTRDDVKRLPPIGMAVPSKEEQKIG
jgi:hypothetical protein